MVIDVDTLRKDFPVLAREVTYLDSANTSQKPHSVIDAIADHYAHHNANVARAMHTLGAEATEAFELGRTKTAAFVGANRREEIIFTKNASEAINLVARTLGDRGGDDRLGPGDEIVISQMEHHSNIVPWQLLAERTGATLRWFEVTDDGRLDLDSVPLSERTKIVAVTWVSNMLGTINPVDEIVRAAKNVGALVVLDASQAVPQIPVNFAETGADFVAFTGHKMLGPTGIGVLWGRYEFLASLPPFLGGGEMIETVTMERSTFAPPPHRFEAGTPPIAQAVGLGAAIDYLEHIGMQNVADHEQAITAYALERLAEIPKLTIVGPAEAVMRGGAISFTIEGVHPHDVAQLLDSRGVAVRAGHHCAKPAHARFGVQSTTRASFYLYTTPAEIDELAEGILHTQKYFGV